MAIIKLILVLVAIVSASHQGLLAEDHDHHQYSSQLIDELPFPLIGILPPRLVPGDVKKCWSSLESIEHCVDEIYESFLTNKFGCSPMCCKAVIQVTDNCWSKMLPFINTLFPSLLKDFCAKNIHGGGGGEVPAPY
ncbi:Prolamin-like domain [Macleaya cordata]|uniref:Prolamin-like domain n=1 Tax=Macleaya cordata TaxID=56857 RepID=A0A200Q7Y3_MACCD|nr:Prolamin-like domain [Macleaya cordata]